MVDVRGYELPTNLQNFTQKDLTEVKIFQKGLGGGATFLKHPVHVSPHHQSVGSKAVPTESQCDCTINVNIVGDD